MAGGQAEAAIQNQLVKAAAIMESAVDAELERMDKLDEDDLEQLRAKRLAEMKRMQSMKQEWLSKGHGVYSELTEKDFFDECKKSKNIVIHFYRPTTERCKIFDMHLSKLATKFISVRFMKIDAEKSPFLTERLKVHVLPSLIVFKDNKTCDIIQGFDDLGGVDEFPTVMLEWRLAQSGVIPYDGDLMTPPWQPSHLKPQGIFYSGRKQRKGKSGGIRETNDSDSDSENDW